MLTIWKYRLDKTDSQQIPEGAQFLSAQMQGDVLCLWMLVDTAKPLETRVFNVVGTGYEIYHAKESLKFLGTVQSDGRMLVFHVFEIIKGEL